MMHKGLKQLTIGGAILAALVLGSAASAGAATGGSGSSSTMATLQASSNGGPPASLTSTRTPGAVAHENAKKPITGDAASKVSAAPLTVGRGGSVGAMHHVRDSWIRDLYLTDHEQYVRHHQRLASLA
jgi:hypothetical protein